MMSMRLRASHILEVFEFSRIKSSLKSPARMKAESGLFKVFIYLMRSIQKLHHRFVSA
jgi:hypothetical protein